MVKYCSLHGSKPIINLAVKPLSLQSQLNAGASRTYVQQLHPKDLQSQLLGAVRCHLKVLYKATMVYATALGT